MIKSQEEKERNKKLEDEKTRVSLAGENYIDSVLRVNSDILNNGRKLNELKEIATKGNTTRNFVNYREDFKLPISEQLGPELSNNYNLIRIFHKERIFKESDGGEYALAKDYLELLENIGAEKKLRKFIVDSVAERTGDLGK
jgi:hypothetical protein